MHVKCPQRHYFKKHQVFWQDPGRSLWQWRYHQLPSCLWGSAGVASVFSTMPDPSCLLLPILPTQTGTRSPSTPTRRSAIKRPRKENLPPPNFLSRACQIQSATWRLQDQSPEWTHCSALNKLISQEHFDLIFLSASHYCTLS